MHVNSVGVNLTLDFLLCGSCGINVIKHDVLCEKYSITITHHLMPHHTMPHHTMHVDYSCITLFFCLHYYLALVLQIKKKKAAADEEGLTSLSSASFLHFLLLPWLRLPERNP